MSSVFEIGPVAAREPGPWRRIASAWLVALIICVIFAGFTAVASLRREPPRPNYLPGVIIPQHHAEFCPDRVCRHEPNPLEHFDTEHYTVW